MACVAQLVERMAFNHVVAGSTPVTSFTIILKPKKGIKINYITINLMWSIIYYKSLTNILQ